MFAAPPLTGSSPMVAFRICLSVCLSLSSSPCPSVCVGTPTSISLSLFAYMALYCSGNRKHAQSEVLHSKHVFRREVTPASVPPCSEPRSGATALALPTSVPVLAAVARTETLHLPVMGLSSQTQEDCLMRKEEDCQRARPCALKCICFYSC